MTRDFWDLITQAMGISTALCLLLWFGATFSPSPVATPEAIKSGQWTSGLGALGSFGLGAFAAWRSWRASKNLGRTD